MWRKFVWPARSKLVFKGREAVCEIWLADGSLPKGEKHELLAFQLYFRGEERTKGSLSPGELYWCSRWTEQSKHFDRCPASSFTMLNVSTSVLAPLMLRPLSAKHLLRMEMKLGSCCLLALKSNAWCPVFPFQCPPPAFCCWAGSVPGCSQAGSAMCYGDSCSPPELPVTRSPGTFSSGHSPHCSHTPFCPLLAIPVVSRVRRRSVWFRFV